MRLTHGALRFCNIPRRYTSEIFMGGKNTLVMHNTCEDSLLATPLILDLCIMAELCERITCVKRLHVWFAVL